jgi:F-type H+-transporting ATPase subunit b
MQWSFPIALTTLLPLPLVGEAAPVVDIDGTVFVQGGLFLALMFILQGLLFKPWLEVREKRAQRIEGALQASRRLRTEAEELGLEYDQRLADARDEALGFRNDARQEAEEEMNGIVTEARKKATAGLEKDREKIREQASAAEQELAARVADMARDIATRVLGRSVS